jgi:hypothetical protein
MSFTLTLFPCGCIVERSMYVHVHRTQVECPWCHATFHSRDFAKWANDVHGVFTIRPPTVLVRVDDHLLEVTGLCDCNALLVREHVGESSFHLRAAPTNIEFLSN